MAKCFFVLSLTVLLLATGFANAAPYNRRSLMQAEEETEVETEELTPEELEAEREAAALEAFARARELRANETKDIIEEALLTAEVAVELYRDSKTTAERIAVFADLFQNADGVAAKFALNTLVARGIKGGRFVLNNCQRGLGSAIADGFSSNVAQAVAYAFTIQRTPGDQEALLDALVMRKEKMDKRKEDSGCIFIKNLFTDADVFANQRFDSNSFLRAFDSEEYLPLTECFLDECSGEAAKCCGDEDALKSGLCGCPRRNSKRCDFNLFAHQPRTVWVCSRRGCVANQKCLCPAAPATTES